MQLCSSYFVLFLSVFEVQAGFGPLIRTLTDSNTVFDYLKLSLARNEVLAF